MDFGPEVWSRAKSLLPNVQNNAHVRCIPRSDVDHVVVRKDFVDVVILVDEWCTSAVLASPRRG